MTLPPGNIASFGLMFETLAQGTNPLDMEAFLTSPSGKTDLCEISDLADSLYDIKFSPAEEGVHTVSLKHRGIHCSGWQQRLRHAVLSCSSSDVIHRFAISIHRRTAPERGSVQGRDWRNGVGERRMWNQECVNYSRKT